MTSREKQVLIFDDDEDILRICSYILRDRGWQVHTETSVVDVLEKTAAVQPDIIIMDNWIPESGGIAATQALKNTLALKHIPVIYFTANNEVEKLAAAAGADQFLAKPFLVADMIRVTELAYHSNK